MSVGVGWGGQPAVSGPRPGGGPAFSVFTCSYNKPAYAPDAIASVLAQTCGDFEYWVLENSTDNGETRRAVAPLIADPRVRYEEITLGPDERMPNAWPGSVLLNRYYPKAAGEFILYLSDDDVLRPNCLERVLEEFTAHPDWDAAWFTMWREAWSSSLGRFRPAGSIPAVNLAGVGSGQPQVDCRIDGGQVVHRRSCLEQMDQPLFPEGPATANHGDGWFLQNLANRYPLHPIPDHLMTHRATPVSCWDKAK